MNKKTTDTKQHILDIGYQIVVTKGFSRMGLSELLKTAEVPKGSFYHYFKSKEQFGEALIQDYFHQYMKRLDTQLHQDSDNYLNNIVRYFAGWIEVVDGTCNAHKCLIVKLGAEVSDLSDPMREALRKGANKIMVEIGKCIENGIKQKQISPQDSFVTAQTLYQLWLGASLISKLSNDLSGLEQALETTKGLLAPS
ncbi:TetR/AcrR family transcriptional regulator [Vibrio sp. S4M6]|uniref:TetR/AcrR family transcriptional regulator n=1 Tax=Vibrio sinus TaxID=2946865 RepID=UPI00202A071B|nr:TetR/AcrR family transcriptional regulator [Vibrio sinus]MCL9779992.1 TetR/AcrR family transcriptional regulator [Vibrio sinus]